MEGGRLSRRCSKHVQAMHKAVQCSGCRDTNTNAHDGIQSEISHTAVSHATTRTLRPAKLWELLRCVISHGRVRSTFPLDEDQVMSHKIS